MMNEVAISVDGVTATMMIPDVLRQYPYLRPVLDRYGLRGCGGALGPAETLEYFARAHGVEARALVAELNAAIRNPGHVSQRKSLADLSRADELGDAIYRRFFKAGIVVVMTAGAAWGAILLLRIGFNGTFGAISLHEINAHGHAQIFGWVGLFVMGFAYQAFPRMKHTNLWRPGLANVTFYLMLFGVFARALGEPFFTRPMFRELALIANVAEIAAVGLFFTIIIATLQRSGKTLERHDGFILAATAFFVVQAIYDLGLLYGTTVVGLPREKLVYLVSVYQGPLRDLQIHGFALLMILGVGIRMFPALFGFRVPGPAAVRAALGLIVVAVLGEAVFFILMRRYGGLAMTTGTYGSMLLLALTTIGLTWRWLARPTESDRSIKFVRAAVGWLHVSMLMLVLAPVYMHWLLPAVATLSAGGRRAVEIGFSHAYGGAVRHAITVGFISMMILGMAAKVVPTLNGVDLRRLRSLWVPFVLVNTGCAMRVIFQIATDFSASAYPIAGVSGLLEVSGIGLWGAHLWCVMNGWAPAAAYAGARPARITADDKVGLIVEWFPQTLPLFLGKGFRPLGNPLMRKTVARTISVRQAAAHQELDLDSLLTELNEAAFGAVAATPGDPPATLPVPLAVLDNGAPS